MFRLDELARVVGGVRLTGQDDTEVRGVDYDSRRIGPGDAFVCVAGFRSDGHRFAPQAVERGARVLFVERPLPELAHVAQVQVESSRRALAALAVHTTGRPADGLTVVGITGTNGKTTSSHYCEAVLRAKGKKPGLIGTIQAKVGERTVPVANTTPESLDLHRLLLEMREAGNDAVAMEVSSHALALDRVHGLPVDVAIFTNLSHDHLDFHTDMEDYFQAKLKLFTGLAYRKGRPAPFAVVNIDDPAGERIVSSLKVPYITYGTQQRAHIRAEEIELGPEGTAYLLETPVGSSPVELRMSGHFNVMNSLAAVGLGLALRVDLDDIVKALETIATVSGRFELVREGQDFAVVVDYAHTPDGLENVLRAARQVTKGRVLAVYGCGGDRDRTKRPLMGEIGGRLADHVILTSDNPRTEDPHAILQEIQSGMNDRRATLEVESDRTAAIFKAIRMAEPGDTVVIAGKGHETYQILGDKTIDFDDREVARAALRGRYFRGAARARSTSWSERRRLTSLEIAGAGGPGGTRGGIGCGGSDS